MTAARCSWLTPAEDPNARYMIPGCFERMYDDTAPCTCPTTAEELAEAQARTDAAEKKADLAARRYQALHSAVLGHPNAAGIYARADQLFAVTPATHEGDPT